MMKDYYNRMSQLEAREFRLSVLDIVSKIPRGSVTTYGAIASLAGWPSHARMVGRTLHYDTVATTLPCHRVVNASGRTAPGWLQQRSMLESEGVVFTPRGTIDMKKYMWQPDDNEIMKVCSQRDLS